MLTLRITLVTVIGYSYPPYLKSLKMSVISDYLYVVAALVLEMMLFHLSIALIVATTEWITVLVSNKYNIYLLHFVCNLPKSFSVHTPTHL